MPQWVRGGRSEATLAVRRQVGRLYLQWRESAKRTASGRLKRGLLKDFVSHYSLGRCSRRLVDWLRRSSDLALREGASSTGVRPTGGAHHRKRRSGRQGRPHLAPHLREELFRWFADIRTIVLGRLPLAVLMRQARILRAREAVRATSLGQPGCRLPKINSSWIRWWRIDYRVSLRVPNSRFKVSRAVFEERMKIMWTNLLRVRALCIEVHGYDPIIEGFDQKPLHFNESGSKHRKTLAWKGAPEVPRSRKRLGDAGAFHSYDIRHVGSIEICGWFAA